MSEARDLTTQEVVRKLGALSTELNTATENLDVAEKDAVNKREDYTLAYAGEFLAAEGAMEVRKQLALQATAAERLAAETAEQVVRGLRRQVDTLRVRIDVGRSMGTALRAEIALAGSGMAP